MLRQRPPSTFEQSWQCQPVHRRVVSYEFNSGEEIGRRDHLKDHRLEAPQMVVGMVTDQQGTPAGASSSAVMTTGYGRPGMTVPPSSTRCVNSLARIAGPRRQQGLFGGFPAGMYVLRAHVSRWTVSSNLLLLQ